MGVWGHSNTDTGVRGTSFSGTGGISLSSSGTYHHAFGSSISAIARTTGALTFLGASADANRTAQRTEILASALRPTETPIVATTHTFTTANEDQIVVSQSSDPTIFTIPLNSAQAFAIGAIVGIERQGIGTLAVTATAGVTLNGTDGASKSISYQWGAAAIRKISINGWVIVGAIA
jgi:hypothetical protein